MSESESEDDFESAESDEESTDDYESSEEESEEEHVVVSSPAVSTETLVKQEKEEFLVTKGLEQLDVSCEELDNSSAATPMTPILTDLIGDSQATAVEETSLMRENVIQTTKQENTLEKFSITPTELSEEINAEIAACLKKPIEEQNLSQAKQNDSVETTQTFDESVMPTEIVNKISTRNISSTRIRPAKSKPSTLGAKKLGGVKLSKTPDSFASALAGLEKEDPIPSSIDDLKSKSAIDQASMSLKQDQNDTGWGWFAPPKSLISSVSSLTNHILSTVENGLNIPEPEDLAKEEMLYAEKVTKDIEPKEEETVSTASTGFSQLIGGVGNITRFVESTGSSLFSSGLDTLESLGKRTINVLQQTDPGLKLTKSVLVNPLQVSHERRPCLSQVLREAKETNEMEALMDAAEPTTTACRSAPSLTYLFELNHGLVHLEALEMLSQQYQTRVTPQIRRLTTQRRAVIEEATLLCTIDDIEEHDNPDEFDLELLEQTLESNFDKIGLQVPLEKIMDSFRRGIDSDVDALASVAEIYSHSLNSLASVTSSSVELLRKSSELLLMADKNTNPAVGGRLEIETLRSIAILLMSEVLRLGSHHASQMIRAEKTGNGANYSTDIYYEASNCCSYVRNAFKLMIPILQSRLL